MNYMIVITILSKGNGSWSEWRFCACRGSSQEQLRGASSAVGPPAGVGPAPCAMPVRCSATELRRWLTRAGVVLCVLGVVVPGSGLGVNHCDFVALHSWMSGC